MSRVFLMALVLVAAAAAADDNSQRTDAVKRQSEAVKRGAQALDRSVNKLKAALSTKPEPKATASGPRGPRTPSPFREARAQRWPERRPIRIARKAPAPVAPSLTPPVPAPERGRYVMGAVGVMSVGPEPDWPDPGNDAFFYGVDYDPYLMHLQ